MFIWRNICELCLYLQIGGPVWSTRSYSVRKERRIYERTTFPFRICHGFSTERTDAYF